MESGLNELMTRIAQEEGPARQGCFYSRDADCVFCHLEDVPYFAERVDGLLTIYRAEEDARLVGAQLKGVSKLPKHDVLGLGLRHEGDVQVLELVLLTFRSQPQPSTPEPEALRRKADYFDVLDRLHGITIPAAELQIA